MTNKTVLELIQESRESEATNLPQRLIHQTETMVWDETSALPDGFFESKELDDFLKKQSQRLAEKQSGYSSSRFT